MIVPIMYAATKRFGDRRRAAKTTGSWLPLSPRLRLRGAEMLHLQCWLWGCDIRRPRGNLLLEYGFSRQRPPVGATGSSAYMKTTDGGVVIVLWGFGAFCGSPTNGGVYLNRYEFNPEYIPRMDTQRLPWLPDQMRGTVIPYETEVQQRMQRQFFTLLEWIAQYESWVRHSCGIEYRQQCVLDWTKKTVSIRVEHLVEEWLHLLHQIALFVNKKKVMK